LTVQQPSLRPSNSNALRAPVTPKYLQAKRRHHYVWAKYLTRWGSGSERVFYTTKTGKIAQDSVRAIAAEEYLYKITRLTDEQVVVIKRLSRMSPDSLHQQHMSYLNDFLVLQQADDDYTRSGFFSPVADQLLHAFKCNLLENLHSSHEQAVQPVLEALADEKLEILGDKQLMVEFMAFFGHQFCRTKPFRDNATRRLVRSSDLENHVADAFVNGWWFLSYMFGMNLGDSLYQSRHQDTHALLINDTTIPFITSDHPIVNVHSSVSETIFSSPDHADLYYPISPRIAYIICNSDRFQPGKNYINVSTAVELNAKLASQAMIHIIGNTQNSIRLFQSFIGKCGQKT